MLKSWISILEKQRKLVGTLPPSYRKMLGTNTHLGILSCNPTKFILIVLANFFFLLEKSKDVEVLKEGILSKVLLVMTLNDLFNIQGCF